MSARLCCLLMVTHVLTANTTHPLDDCLGSNGEQSVAVKGWPVLVALAIPGRATVTLKLSLSVKGDVHTNLTLTHKDQISKVGLLETELMTQMARIPLHTAALLPDSHRAKLSLVRGQKRLELRVDSEDRSTRYSTIALLNTTHDLHVDTVTCTPVTCTSYIDLQCLYNNYSQTDKGNHTEEEKPNSGSGMDKGAYYWAFYVVISLLVMVCLLFLVWRNERSKFRARLPRHSHAARMPASASIQEGNPLPAERSDAVGWGAGSSGGRCSLYGYVGPCNGDSDN